MPREADALDDIRLGCNSSWYTYFGAIFGAVACRYYAELVPEGVPCRVHCPLQTLRVYVGRVDEDDETPPPFAMALVSCQWDHPAPTGEARFRIDL